MDKWGKWYAFNIKNHTRQVIVCNSIKIALEIRRKDSLRGRECIVIWHGRVDFLVRYFGFKRALIARHYSKLSYFRRMNNERLRALVHDNSIFMNAKYAFSKFILFSVFVFISCSCCYFFFLVLHFAFALISSAIYQPIAFYAVAT